MVKTYVCNYDLENEIVGSQDQITSYQYDKYGNVLSTQEYNGYVSDVDRRYLIHTNEYDLQNRLLKKSICNSLSECLISEPPYVEKFRYDEMGRLVETS